MSIIDDYNNGQRDFRGRHLRWADPYDHNLSGAAIDGVSPDEPAPTAEAVKHDDLKPAYHLIDMGVLFDLNCMGPSLRDQSDELVCALAALVRFGTGRGGSEAIWSAFAIVACELDAENPDESAQFHMASVLAHGAQKYDAHNWRKGFAWSRLWRASYGHIVSHMRGEETELRVGLPHLAHALCALMFLVVHQRDGLGVDDRAEVLR
jgi:hypothetical protein